MQAQCKNLPQQALHESQGYEEPAKMEDNERDNMKIYYFSVILLSLILQDQVPYAPIQPLKSSSDVDENE